MALSDKRTLDTQLRLKVLEGGHQQSEHELKRPVVSLGRSTPETPYSASYLTFPEPTLSRLHAVLTWEPGASTYMVHHRSQTNPSLLNGKRLEHSTLLKAGDVLSLGRLVLLLEEQSPQSPAQDQNDQISPGLFLQVRQTGENQDKLYTGAVELKQLSLQLTSSGDTAAISCLKSESDTQLLRMPADTESELLFELTEDAEGWTVELSQERNSYRRTALPFGHLKLPLSPQKPQPISTSDIIFHDGYEIWLSHTQDQGHALDKLPRPSVNNPTLRFLNGAWAGAELRILSTETVSFELNKTSKDFCHRLPFPRISPAQISISPSFDVAQLRAGHLDDDQFIDLDGELLFYGEAGSLYSGAKFLLGDAEFQWLVPAQHQKYTDYQISADCGTKPITKARVRLGTAAHCEVRFQSSSVAPVVGSLHQVGDEFVYHHLNIACPARVNGEEISAGLECKIHKGSTLELAPGFVVRLQRIE